MRTANASIGRLRIMESMMSCCSAAMILVVVFERGCVFGESRGILLRGQASTADVPVFSNVDFDLWARRRRYKSTVILRAKEQNRQCYNSNIEDLG